MWGRKLKISSVLVHRLLVPKCVSCGEPLSCDERALCRKCKSDYLEVKTRNCPCCANIYSECSCTNAYLSRHFIKGLAKLVPYRSSEEFAVSNSVIYKMKKCDRKDVFDFMADELVLAISAALPPVDAETIITNVPNRQGAIIKYGFDHAAELAKAVAERLGCKYIPLLYSLSKKPQKTLVGQERINNATFELSGEPMLKGKTIIIIDDIVTTGASMGNSATMIRALSPKAIYGACIAVARPLDTRSASK